MKNVMCLALLAFRAFAAAAEPPAYDMDLVVAPEQGTIEGSVKLTLPAGSVTQGEAFLSLLLNAGEKQNPKVFPFIENGVGPDGFSPSRAAITDLRVNGTAQAVRYVSSRLSFYTYNLERMYARIDLSGVDAAADAVVEFHYQVQLPHRKLPDDFHFDDKMISRFSWFPYLARDGRLDEWVLTPFTYKARVSLSTDWAMARIGTSFDRAANAVTVASDAPVSSFPLAFTKGYAVYSVDWLKDSRTLDICYKPTSEDVARLVSAYAREALEYYAARYFPYEARYVSIVQANPGGYGEAADSLVLLGDGIFAGINRILPGVFARSLEYTVDHEIGHLYWGIGSPPDFYTENYLSEGLNEYSTLAWYEQKYGRWDNLISPQPDVLGQLVVDELAQIEGHSYASAKIYLVLANRLLGWDVPLSGSLRTKIANAASTVDYHKSWFVLSMLAQYVGKERFQTALRDFAIAYRYRPVSSRDLQEFLGRSTGMDLKPFFDLFVYGTASVDYALAGSANKPAGGSYQSTFTIRDLQTSGIFVPTTLTVFLQDGSSREVPVSAPGEYTVRTESPVAYAGVDKDAENLDYDRKNNFWPRRIVWGYGSDLWLADGASDKLYPTILPFVQVMNDGVAVGEGLILTDTARYTVSLSPYGLIPNDPAALDAYAVGLALQSVVQLGGALSLSTSALYAYPSRILDAQAGLSKLFYLPVDIGYTERTYLPVFSAALTAGVGDLDLVSMSGSVVVNGSLSMDLTQVVGTSLTITDSVVWPWQSSSWENRTSVDFAQAIPFFPKTLLGIEIGASANLGSNASFKGSNVVLGIDSTGEGIYRYDASARMFLGLPLLNYIETQVANLVVIQSLNIGLTYAIGTAFNGPKEIVPTLQQAVGFEVLPLLRTGGDLMLGLALGVSFDLNAISARPSDPSSYRPAFFLDTSVFAGLFNAVMPY